MDRSKLAVVFEEPERGSSANPYIYFPFRYLYGPDFPQYSAEPDVASKCYYFARLTPRGRPLTIAELNVGTIVLLSSTVQYTNDIAYQMRHGVGARKRSSVERYLSSVGYDLIEERVYSTFSKTDMAIFRKKDEASAMPLAPR
jgi:hypothetical protein